MAPNLCWQISDVSSGILMSLVANPIQAQTAKIDFARDIGDAAEPCLPIGLMMKGAMVSDGS